MTQAGRVYSLLRNMIFTRELKPGQAIPLEPTALRLGVSVGPVRDALRTLYHRKLVEKRSTFGYRVVRMTLKRVEGYEVIREALFVQAARRAAERITGAEVEALYPLAERLDRMIRSDGNHAAREEAETAFHRRIVQIADCADLEEEMTRLDIFGNLVALVSSAELHCHKAIVDALASRDIERADDEMRRHCSTNRQKLLAATDSPYDKESAAEEEEIAVDRDVPMACASPLAHPRHTGKSQEEEMGTRRWGV